MRPRLFMIYCAVGALALSLLVLLAKTSPPTGSRPPSAVVVDTRLLPTTVAPPTTPLVLAPVPSVLTISTPAAGSTEAADIPGVLAPPPTALSPSTGDTQVATTTAVVFPLDASPQPTDTLVGVNQSPATSPTAPVSVPTDPEGGSPTVLLAPADLASAFAIASYSYRFDDAPADWLARTTRLATPDYSTRLQSQAPDAHVWADRQAQRVIASCLVDSLSALPAGPTGALSFSVHVHVAVVTATGTADERLVLTVTLQPTGSTWLVSGMTMETTS